MKKVLTIIGIIILGLAEIALSVYIAKLAYTHIYSPIFKATNAVTQPSVDISGMLASVKNKVQTNAEWNAFSVYTDKDTQSSDAMVYTAVSEYGSPLGMMPKSTLKVSLNSSAPYTQADVDTLLKNATTALEAEGLHKTNTTAPREVVASYESMDIACSLTAIAGATTATIDCLDKMAVSQTASLAKRLSGQQDIDTNAAKYSSFKQVSDKDKAHSVTTLTTYGSEGEMTHSLIYTKDSSEDWIYVDDMLTGQGGANGGGKVLSTPNIDELLQDSVYGPLYLELIGAKKQ